MNESDVRILALVAVALIASLLFALRLNRAAVEGTLLGIRISVSGPCAMFIALILVFSALDLFEDPSARDSAKRRELEFLERQLEDARQLELDVREEKRQLEERRRQLQDR